MYLLGLFNKGLGFYSWATHHEDFVSEMLLSSLFVSLSKAAVNYFFLNTETKDTKASQMTGVLRIKLKTQKAEPLWLKF